ncbi:MAG: YmdB family metallophosphoesterase, partial [Pseudomonadota bacterium]|nr:YmdB family metallophosphoesterase [Pseudomonadota bacterium]
MKLLFLGDVVGRSGRTAIQETLPRLREAWKLDFVVVNGENATNGAGLSAEHAKLILAAGADVITLGDHAFDQKDMMSFIEQENRIIRPINYARSAPGKGYRIFDAPGGRKVLVAQVLPHEPGRAPRVLHGGRLPRGAHHSRAVVGLRRVEGEKGAALGLRGGLGLGLVGDRGRAPA